MTVLNPDLRNLPLLDPKDQALLLDPAGGGLDFGRLHGHHAGGTPPVAANVLWLCKTEYISRDSMTASRTPAADMFVPSPPLPSPPLPSPPHPPPPSNNSFHVDRASRMTQWTYRARRRSHPSRIHSQPCAAQSSSARCGSRPNHVCAPSRYPRHSRT